jgi:hypothetical protein
MKLCLPFLAFAILFVHGNIQRAAFAQIPLFLYEPVLTTLPGFHTDVFGTSTQLDTNRPIQSMSLRLELHFMNQLSLGLPTVFRPEVPSILVSNDSHFLLDPAQFTVLSTFEDDIVLQADILFTDPNVVFPSPFPNFVQAVAADGHVNPDGTNGTFSGSGRYQDGGTFQFSTSIIPEPSTLLLSLLGLSAVCITRRRKQA